VGKPDVRNHCGAAVLGQFLRVENAGIRDMLQDIAMEEFSHLEMVRKLIAQHTRKIDQTPVTMRRCSG
jgi:Mn-containing catalase